MRILDHANTRVNKCSVKHWERMTKCNPNMYEHASASDIVASGSWMSNADSKAQAIHKFRNTTVSSKRKKRPWTSNPVFWSHAGHTCAIRRTSGQNQARGGVQKSGGEATNDGKTDCTSIELNLLPTSRLVTHSCSSLCRRASSTARFFIQRACTQSTIKAFLQRIPHLGWEFCANGKFKSVQTYNTRLMLNGSPMPTQRLNEFRKPGKSSIQL
jgi:hypothetical protein